MTGDRGSGPKYEQVKLALLEDISRGSYVPGRSFITEREVCRRFGVSRITAVRALNELVQSGVLVRQQGRGTFVAEGPGPERPPQGPGGRMIACLFHEIHGQHVMEILQGIQEVCAGAETNVLLFDSTYRAEQEAANLRKAREAGASGIIVYAVDGFANASVLAAPGPPLVMIDRYYPALLGDAVLPDSFGAAQQVTTRLIEAGHRRIAVVWGEIACTSVTDGFAGYQRAMIEHGLEVEPELAAPRPYDSLPSHTRHAMLRSWLADTEGPRAFAAANAHTLWVLRCDLLDIGADLDDLAMASFADDNPTALEAIGALSATIPSREMGATAARILLDRIEGGQGRVRRVVLPVTLRAPIPRG